MRYLYDQSGFYIESVNTEDILENSTSINPIGVVKPKIKTPGDPDSDWLSGMTSDESKEYKLYQINQLIADYEERITQLVSTHIQNLLFDLTPLPAEIKAERQSLIDERDRKITEIENESEYK